MCIVSTYCCNHITIFNCNLSYSICKNQSQTLLKAGANCNKCAIAKNKELNGWRKNLLLELIQIQVTFDALLSDSEEDQI